MASACLRNWIRRVIHYASGAPAVGVCVCEGGVYVGGYSSDTALEADL